MALLNDTIEREPAKAGGEPIACVRMFGHLIAVLDVPDQLVVELQESEVNAVWEDVQGESIRSAAWVRQRFAELLWTFPRIRAEVSKRGRPIYGTGGTVLGWTSPRGRADDGPVIERAAALTTIGRDDEGGLHSARFTPLATVPGATYERPPAAEGQTWTTGDGDTWEVKEVSGSRARMRRHHDDEERIFNLEDGGTFSAGWKLTGNWVTHVRPARLAGGLGGVRVVSDTRVTIDGVEHVVAVDHACGPDVTAAVTMRREGAVNVIAGVQYFTSAEQMNEAFGPGLGADAERLFRRNAQPMVVYRAGGQPTPRCGQTWQLDGLEGVVFDEHPPGSFHIRLSTARRIVEPREGFATLTFVSGPTSPETPREAFERVIRLEAADVPAGLSGGQWLGLLLNKLHDYRGTSRDTEPLDVDIVRKEAGWMRDERAARWARWSSDRVGDPRAGR